MGAWLTLLLFISGLMSPRLVVAMPADCPMRQMETVRCAATPEPLAETPPCCREREAEIARAGTISVSCCCDMTAAKESAQAPALLSVVTEAVALPLIGVSLRTPPVHTALLSARFGANQTAPRAPPLRSSPPRAPPRF